MGLKVLYVSRLYEMADVVGSVEKEVANVDESFTEQDVRYSMTLEMRDRGRDDDI